MLDALKDLSCQGCKHVDLENDKMPCLKCKRQYYDRYETRQVVHIEMNELVELLKNNIMPLGVTNREIMEYLTKKETIEKYKIQITQ